MKKHYNKSEAEARALWDAAVKDPQVPKGRDHFGNTTVAHLTNQTLKGGRAVSSKKAVAETKSHTIEDAASLQSLRTSYLPYPCVLNKYMICLESDMCISFWTVLRFDGLPHGCGDGLDGLAERLDIFQQHSRMHDCSSFPLQYPFECRPVATSDQA